MLAANGYLPVTLDNLSTGHRWSVKWGPLEIGDMADRAFVSKLIARYEPAAVMHFAALSLVGESASQPARYYGNNVAGTLSLLEAMRDGGVNKLVFSSTCATYGEPDSCPIAESTPQLPINVYGRSKLMVETILKDFAAAYGFRTAALRYFNAAGAADMDGIGEAHEPETHLIPLVIAAALGERGPVQVFGTDYPTADGTCERDYIHVDDLGAAHVRAIDFLEATDGFHAFNLGTGRPFSVRQVIAAVATEAGHAVPHQIAPRRAGDPPALYADPRQAQDILGWQATQSDLTNIVASAWRWHTASAGTKVRRAI
jgi:UDP-glucose-4-epimerase GalE